MAGRTRTLVTLTCYDVAGATARTFYVSDGPYATTPAETPVSTVFMPVLRQALAVRRRVQGIRFGLVQPSVGDLVLENGDGALDAWAAYAWDGWSVTVKTGLASDAYADFTTVFTGTIERLDVRRDTLVLRVRDAVAALGTPLQTDTFAGDNVPPAGLEGESELEGVAKPRVYGSVRNVPLTLVNAQKLIYHVSDKAVASVDDVYDSGTLLSVTEPNTPATISNLRAQATDARVAGLAYSPLLDVYVVGEAGTNAPSFPQPALYSSPDFSTWTGRTSAFDQTVDVGAAGVRQVRWFSEAGYFVAVGQKTTGGGSDFLGTCATSPDGTTWTEKDPTGGFATIGNEARCAAFGKGTLVVGGESGVLRYSTDNGTSWADATASGLTQRIQDIWFADGLFVLVASGGVIYTSNDGITWTARTSGTASNLTAVRFISGRWVITGNSGVVLTSLDSVTWLARTDGTGAGKDDIADDGYTLVAIGGTSSPTISYDRGATWKTLTLTGITARACTFDGSRIRVFGSGGKTVSLVTTKSYASDADLEDDSLAPPPGTYAVRIGATGTYIRLGSIPFGQVTADVTHGATAADRTAAQLMLDVLTDAGYTSSDWVAADFTALDTADDGECGLYVRGTETVAECLDRLAQSVGAWWGVDALGRFRVQQLAAPSGSPTFTIRAEQVLGLDRVPSSDALVAIPTTRTTLRYARNYTVQREGVAGAVSAARKADLGREWREAVVDAPSVLTAHKLATSVVEDTCYTTQADAAAEATRRQTLRGTQRNAFQVTVPFDDFAAVALGDVGTLTHPRFGLSGGVLVRVLGIEPHAAERTITLTCWY